MREPLELLRALAFPAARVKRVKASRAAICIKNRRPWIEAVMASFRAPAVVLPASQSLAEAEKEPS